MTPEQLAEERYPKKDHPFSFFDWHQGFIAGYNEREKQQGSGMRCAECDNRGFIAGFDNTEDVCPTCKGGQSTPSEIDRLRDEKLQLLNMVKTLQNNLNSWEHPTVCRQAESLIRKIEDNGK